MSMTAEQFRAIRHRLGLTQEELATVLGYSLAMQVSEIERATNPKPVPRHVAMLMTAFDKGYRTDDWPTRQADH
jgi:transcriptional regulator with XRE-family HTH domain